jgi:predicted nuclease with TOPRIM domain
MIKPSQMQMKSFLEKRKLERSKDMDTSNSSLNSIIQRSKTIRHPSSTKKAKAAQNDESMNKSQLGNQSQIIDVQRWKMKFDIIVE